MTHERDIFTLLVGGLDCYRSGECDYETGICSCANLFGFTGEVCEDHECMCLNEGKCEPDNSGSTVCRCPIGFGGLACEIPGEYYVKKALWPRS